MQNIFDTIIDRTKNNSIKHCANKNIFGTNDIIPLWVADMDFKAPQPVIDALENRASHGVFGYTMRDEEYESIIKKWVGKRYKWKIKNEHINYSPGVVSAIAMSILTYTKPGDKIIVQSPVYFPFFTTVENNGRRIINNQLKINNNRYEMDFDLLDSQIDSQTKMLILSNPHNPVGRAWELNELHQLGEIVKKHNLIVISDEIHADIIFDNKTHIPFASIDENIAQQTITCISPSKTFNIAGLSTSVVIIENKRLMADYTNIIESLHINLSNPFGMVALKAAYSKGEPWLKELLKYLESNRDYVYKFINNEIKELKCYLPEATYLMWIDFNNLNLSEHKLNKLLVKDAKLGLSNGSLFGKGGSGFERLNFGSPRSVIKKALVQLKQAVSEL